MCRLHATIDTSPGGWNTIFFYFIGLRYATSTKKSEYYVYFDINICIFDIRSANRIHKYKFHWFICAKHTKEVTQFSNWRKKKRRRRRRKKNHLWGTQLRPITKAFPLCTNSYPFFICIGNAYVFQHTYPTSSYCVQYCSDVCVCVCVCMTAAVCLKKKFDCELRIAALTTWKHVRTVAVS